MIQHISRLLLGSLLLLSLLHCNPEPMAPEPQREAPSERSPGEGPTEPREPGPEPMGPDAAEPGAEPIPEPGAEPIPEPIPEPKPEPKPTEPSIFRRQNLVAWAVVPYDAKKRDPSQRAAMLKRLGFTKFAYDWRAEDVPHFEAEILALKQQGIAYFAFWLAHGDIFPLLLKHKVDPQFWWISPSPEAPTQSERLQKAVDMVLPQVKSAAQRGHTLGLYNHLGWGGEPENMVAIVQRIHSLHKLKNIGIVYNFHHGHDHIPRFARALALMKPYLLCVNLNGMNDTPQPKILTLGQGKHERDMLQALRKSGYKGAIGLLAHQAQLDAEVVLQANIDGLKQILKEQGDADALASYSP